MTKKLKDECNEKQCRILELKNLAKQLDEEE